MTMKITLETVGYSFEINIDDPHTVPSAEIWFAIDDGHNDKVDVLAFINEHAGQFGFGLFTGIGGDYSLADELGMSDPRVKEAIIRLAESRHIDVADKEALEEFLNDLEDEMCKMIPQMVWARLREHEAKRLNSLNKEGGR